MIVQFRRHDRTYPFNSLDLKEPIPRVGERVDLQDGTGEGTVIDVLHYLQGDRYVVITLR